MEELLSYNWNIYKLFSNGNRAKAPFAILEGKDCESEDFTAMVRKNLEEKFGAKARSTKYKIMRADLPQEERVDEEEKKNLVLRNRVLSTKIKALGLNLQNKRTTGALVMSGDTSWKWQWCVLRMSSNQFIAALSPEFNSTEMAQAWMKDEIELITT
jgi:hypothetical protein|tara:strand:- start:843 stop:1313 length:471 start_codon:yes stop_codon:yes gene_type:complete